MVTAVAIANNSIRSHSLSITNIAVVDIVSHSRLMLRIFTFRGMDLSI